MDSVTAQESRRVVASHTSRSQRSRVTTNDELPSGSTLEEASGETLGSRSDIRVERKHTRTASNTPLTERPSSTSSAAYPSCESLEAKAEVEPRPEQSIYPLQTSTTQPISDLNLQSEWIQVMQMVEEIPLPEDLPWNKTAAISWKCVSDADLKFSRRVKDIG
jgi:hypothetical protein